MKKLPLYASALSALAAFTLPLVPAGGSRTEVRSTATRTPAPAAPAPAQAQAQGAARTLAQGKRIFRFDTFGSEAFWGDALGLHRAIAGAANGGVGPGVSPNTALAVGLKVDVDALPPEVVDALEAGTLDLDDPATTIALFELDAVVGVRGAVPSPGELASIGLTCAVCHSTVDDSLAPGIGRRLDGWPNRDLDPGAIIALSPSLAPFEDLLGLPEDDVRAVFQSWGPGRFDAHVILDGVAFRPDGKTAAVMLPAAFGLAGVDRATYNGWGSVSYWNTLVANLEMGGSGTLFDPRLDDASKYPVAAAAGFGHVSNDDDQITPKLSALHAYQLSLAPPTPPAGSFDVAAAERGKEIFEGVAGCADCHVPPLYTEPGWNLHLPSEIGIDSFQADRGPEGRYRTTPLRGLFTRLKGGLYHDGRFADLDAVVEHYDALLGTGLRDDQKSDLVQFLLSL